MTTEEFSNEFDILYNNIMSNQAPGLNEYEKSVFLTEAQNVIVLELYTGRGAKGLSFESSEESRRLLQNLIVKKEITITNDKSNPYIITKPSKEGDGEILAIVYEECKLNDNIKALVVPVKHDSLYETLNNPFKGPSKNRVLRVDSSDIELYSNNTISSYTMTYLKKPTPIILDNLEGVKIDDKNTKTECILDSSLHFDILQRAVLMAKASYTGS